MIAPPKLGDSSPRTGTPRLFVDARTRTADGIDAGHRLLGLSLLERTTLAARRSGYGAIFVLAQGEDVERFRRLLARIAGATVDAALPERDDALVPTVCVSGLVLGERGWLDAAAGLAVPADGVLAPFAGVVVCGADVPPGRAAGLLAEAPASASAAASAEVPFHIAGAADLRAAEKRLLRSLGKKTDGYMERHVERPISWRISRLLASTPITPNQMTLFSAAVGLLAAPFFLSAAPLWQTIGALLFLAHSILDGCDGELARLKFQESRWGGILDFWGDNVVHSAIFGCMAVGWSHAIGTAWPLALGAAAVLGTLGSASFVYWRVMRPKRGEGPLYVSVAKGPGSRLTGLLDSLSRRDFIYLVLILSLPGKAAWFLALAAIGAPIFFAMLLVVAAQERTHQLARP